MGKLIPSFTSFLVKGLSIVGTAAMLIVGGSILVHGLAGITWCLHHAKEGVQGVAGIGGALAAITPSHW